MSIGRFKILYLPGNSSSVREFRFSRNKIFLLFGGFAILLLFLVVSLTFVSRILISDYQMAMLQRENVMLNESIVHAEEKMLTLQNQIDKLITSDEKLRLLADIPLIDEETREAGIGGSLPSPGIDIGSDLAEYLNKLERQVELQKVSFAEIHSKINRNLDIAKCTPAICPVTNPRLTSGYGWREDPFSGVLAPHRGLDFGAERGTPVFATADGKVVMTKRVNTFGKVILIDHGYGYETLYGHLQSYNVKSGQTVKRGDIIGTVGNTGRSTAPHLHYEVRVNHEQVNPADFMFEEILLTFK
ncbi:M23 family metallopeptidase [bacterium]|nr:M23 family metallopeptidase [FCB group bacterium]MBL7192009.1 M23 family metallopeptidase [bacterium]